MGRVELSLANEARIVDAHLASARPARPSGGGVVVAATVVAGPWAGLFVAMRNLQKRG